VTASDPSGWRHRLESRPLLSDHPVALRVTLALWALGGVLFIALAIPSFESVVQGVDDAIHRLMVELEFTAAVRVAKALDFVGSSWVTAPVMVGVAVYLAWRKRWEGMIYWVLSMVLSQAFIGIAKTAYGRSRPPLSLVETTGYSFPSGHAVAAAAIAIGLVIVLVPAGPRRRNLEMLAAAFAVAMGLSRVYLRAHWISDVVAGVALGAAVAIGVAVAMHYVVQRSGRQLVAKPHTDGPTSQTD